jgi:hypothetical protein
MLTFHKLSYKYQKPLPSIGTESAAFGFNPQFAPPGADTNYVVDVEQVEQQQ